MAPESSSSARPRIVLVSLVLALAAFAALAATGCSAAPQPTAPADQSAASSTAPAEQTTAPADEASATQETTPAETQPAVKVTKVKIKDVKVGTGPAAKAGDILTVHYTGWLTDGTKFDSSVGGQPFKFTLGAGEVIPGWDQGLVGMKVGGKRRLTIASDLAYGAQGAPPTIPPNATLIFDVTLVKIN
jgi:FKBP-type peptidyl-prolyl cis-trans isomerase